MQAIKMSRALPAVALALGLLGGSVTFADETAPGMDVLIPADTKQRHTDADGLFEFTDLPADCRFRRCRSRG